MFVVIAQLFYHNIKLQEIDFDFYSKIGSTKIRMLAQNIAFSVEKGIKICIARFLKTLFCMKTKLIFVPTTILILVIFIILQPKENSI